MSALALLAGACIGCFVLLAPQPLFDAADRRHVRGRLRASPPTGQRASTLPAPRVVVGVALRARSAALLRRRGGVDLDLAARRSLDAVARHLAAGDTLVQALRRACHDDPFLQSCVGDVVQQCERGVSLAAALRATPPPPRPTPATELHRALGVASSSHATADGARRVLTLASEITADRADVRRERRAQSSQARLSATVLTWVPAGVAGLCATVDGRVRHVLLHTQLGMLCLVGGVGLALVGQRWVRRLVEGDARQPVTVGPNRSGPSAVAIVGGCAVLTLLALLVAGPLGAAVVGGSWWLVRRWRGSRHEARVAEAARQALPELVELLAVVVASGSPPARALHDVRPFCPAPLLPALDDVLHRTERGQRFIEAVPMLRRHLGLDAAALVDVLVAADRDGLPLEHLLTRLSAEARLQRRREAEAEARRLPVRLAGPLVLCTLPGFVLLAIVPLVAGTLSSLSLP